MKRFSAYWRLARPRQWVKNLLVAAAPLAAGRWGDPTVAIAVAAAFAAFCLLSAGVYAINDVLDAPADREHPRKRSRPVAAGEVSAAGGVIFGVVLLALGLGLAFWTRPEFGVLAVTYVVVQVLYSLRLKHEPVLDLAVVTAGFVLRAVAGGVAADIAISQWFLLVTGFGSLFVVAGKRYSELRTLGGAATTRRALAGYSETYLRFVWSIAAATAVMSYSLWAFDPGDGVTTVWHTVSIAFFLLGVLRYAVDIDAGLAAEPEDIVWRDRILQVIGVLWLAILMVGLSR